MDSPSVPDINRTISGRSFSQNSSLTLFQTPGDSVRAARPSIRDMVYVDAIGSHTRTQKKVTPPYDPNQRLAAWRCNLTALSQHHNLYFVAHGPEINVYQPQYPSQAIQSKPLLILVTTPSADAKPGYIEPRRPHCVNSLLIHDLGNEEVIVAARDDGDVDAFWIRQVVHAINIRTTSSANQASTLGPHAPELRPFFQCNVGASAWGLAVHKQARVLAVSCNTHQVTVFELGMGGTTRCVVNGRSNIPSIAFCNTGHDPEARFLLTTDIHGDCRLIDLQTAGMSRHVVFRLDHRTSHRSHEYGSHIPGWIIRFIDPRSFLDCKELPDATGVAPELDPNLVTHLRDCLDLTRSIERLTDVATEFCVEKGHDEVVQPTEPFPVLQLPPNFDTHVDRGANFSDTTSDSDDEAMFAAGEGVTEAPFLSVDDALGSDDNDDDGGVPLFEGLDNAADEQHSQPDHIDILQVRDVQTSAMYISHRDGRLSEADVFPTVGDDGAEASQFTGDGNTALYNANVAMGDLDSDEIASSTSEGDSTLLEDSNPVIHGAARDPGNHSHHNTTDGEDELFSRTYRGPSLYAARPNYSLLTTGEFAGLDLPCPIFHASHRHIHLLQPWGRRHPDIISPVVRLSDPLEQDIQTGYGALHDWERLNMYAEIPPLGLIIVASQVGRVMIMLLTRHTIYASYKPSKRRKKKHEAITYLLRIERILPTASQEAANERPFMPLLGIATSRIQGSKKRWRLLLYYMDHTILAYEIGRTGFGEESELQLEQLVT